MPKKSKNQTAGYEVVVGIEIHVQLDTKTKMFCDCLLPDNSNIAPNTHICQICMGFPGTLPVVNLKAVEKAVILARALNCDINPRSFWDRKQYFYPDLTKGYQITQYEAPFANGGKLADIPCSVTAGSGKLFSVELERIHLEEDTGKSFHDDSGNTFIDFNRGGTPLVEIVTKPQITARLGENEGVTAGDLAKAFLEELQFILKKEGITGDWTGISRARPEEGNIRFDVNISVRKSGTEKLGTKQEIKNLNSFEAVKKAIDIQSGKQVEQIEAGEKIEQSTWTYDAGKNDTIKLRSKEDAHDYRYFREPDLDTLKLDESWLKADIVEIAGVEHEILGRYEILTLDFVRDAISSKACADNLNKFVDKCIALGMKSDDAAKVLSLIYYKYLKPQGDEHILEKLPLFEEGIYFLLEKRLSGKIASGGEKGFDGALKKMMETRQAPSEFIHEFETVGDSRALDKWVDEVISNNPSQVAEYKAGKEPVLAYLVGQVMRASQGKADAKLVAEILKKKL